MRNRREESAQPNLPLVPLGSAGEVPGYGYCRQNYLHNYFYDRNTTCTLLCYAKLGPGLSKIVSISLTSFSLGEWQDLYPCLRMKLSQQSEVLRKSSPKKINAQYNEICPNSNLSSTHFSSLLSIGWGYTSVNAINSQITQSCIYISLPVPFPYTYRRRSRCLKKTVMDYVLFFFTSTQVPWLCSFHICIQLSNKTPSKSPKTTILIRLNYCWPNPI